MHYARAGGFRRTLFRGCLRNFHVAIVGSGPAGFYTAQTLLSNNDDVKVCMYEQLPVPFGLVRFGVAPDHDDTKNVTNQFSRIGAHERFSFAGNVEIGVDVPLSSLQENYSAVVLAYGCQSDNHLSIPGSDLSGVHSARSFVNWYNGHPHFRDLVPDLSCEEVAIVGNGNVAIDIARLLVKDIDELSRTDIARHALDQLAQSSVRRVHILGRRGPAQGAFANKELRELAGFPCTTHAAEMQLSAADKEEAKQRVVKRKLKILDGVPDFADDVERFKNGGKQVSLRFLRSPHQVLPSASGDKIGSLELKVMQTTGEPGKQRAEWTGELETLGNIGMLITSVGYEAEALNGMAPRAEWEHNSGRLEGYQGVYIAGWLKRGPSGIIGTNIPDAKQTAESVLADASDGVISSHTGEAPDEVIRSRLEQQGYQVVSWEDWLAIEKHETIQGKMQGKLSQPPREKLVDADEMLKIVRDARS